MKKLTLFSLFLILTCGAFTQGTLQFNQAILMTNTQTLTVPSGKVWKVVSATIGDRINYGDDMRFYININSAENHFQWAALTQSYGDRTSGMMALPLWLPAGTVVNVPTYGSGAATTRIRNISIIEFNIVP